MNDQNKNKFQNFLDDFCRSHHGELTENDRLPLRFFSNYLTVKEVEAECIDWVLQYLTSKCPDLLAAKIARLVADHVLKLDLSAFVAEDDDEEETKKVEESLEPDTVLLVSALAPVVFTKVHSVCAEWNHSLPDNILTSKAKSPVLQQVTAHATKNGRRKMEDRHVVLQYLGEVYSLKSNPDQSYIAVFDGHGGLYASIYASAHFHDNLVKHPQFYDDPATAIKATFRQTDEDFCNKAVRESLGSGTTGVCALLQGNMLHVGWLGDSEALLVRDGQPVTLVLPHKPERKDEQERIEALGGFVEYTDAYRVNGFISVARAIGDRNLKPYLCSDADITSVQLEGTEDYIVLACDGLWDVVTHEEIVTHVYHHVTEHNGDKSGVAQMLIRLAQDYESEDNITVVVAFFREKLAAPRLTGENQQQEAAQGSGVKVTCGENSSNTESGNSGTDSKDTSTNKESSTENHTPTDQDISLQTDLPADKEVMADMRRSTYKDSSIEKESRSMIHQISKNEECSNSKETSGCEDKSGSKNTSGDKDMSGDKDTSGDKDCTGSKEVLLSWNKGSSGVTSCSSAPRSKEKLAMSSIHQTSQHDSKDSSSKSSKLRSVHIERVSNGGGSTGSPGSEMVLMSQMAAKCVGYRRGRRGRNGRRRNNHRDIRRSSKESQSSGVALRTNNGMCSRLRSSSESKVSAYASPQRQGMSYSHGSKDGVFRMLMGYNPYTVHRPRSHNRWTVAVAMETDSAAAMFDDVSSTKVEPATLPRRQRKK